MDTQSILLFISVPLLFMKVTYTEVGFLFFAFLREWAILEDAYLPNAPCQGFLLLNPYKVCLLSFTISFKNQFKKKPNRNFNFILQNTYHLCGSSTNEAYIYFQHVSSPHDTRKHFYVDTNSAIYWLQNVCMTVCTPELISSSHGDDVLL